MKICFILLLSSVLLFSAFSAETAPETAPETVPEVVPDGVP